MQAVWIFTGILVLVLILFFASRTAPQSRSVLKLPPAYEFVYGAALDSSNAIPRRIEQFLSLEALDPRLVRIQTYAGDSSAENLKPLIKYISSLRRNDFEALLEELKKIDRLKNQKEKIVQTINALLPYKEPLRSDLDPDTIIIFAFYGLKQPADLTPLAREKIASLVRRLDTVEQSAAFDSGKFLSDSLIGNINIYPLALDNTSWHDSVEFGSPKNAPVLEIRFMSLKGVFTYLLDEMTVRTGLSFVHMDGDSL